MTDRVQRPRPLWGLIPTIVEVDCGEDRHPGRFVRARSSIGLQDIAVTGD